jgi:hypothetical protein
VVPPLLPVIRPRVGRTSNLHRKLHSWLVVDLTRYDRRCALTLWPARKRNPTCALQSVPYARHLGASLGRTRTIDRGEIIRKTRQERPANTTRWTTRTLARALGISEATVRRAWHAYGLKPQLVDTFKVSRDPQFIEKRLPKLDVRASERQANDPSSVGTRPELFSNPDH